MAEEDGVHQDRMLQLQDDLEQQQQHRGPAFGTLYGGVCDRIRAQDKLDAIMEEFQKCTSDQARIQYVWQLPEVEELSLKRHTSSKCPKEAGSCEELYDMLVSSESNAARALEVVQRALQKTPVDQTNSMAIRYMKRAWALLLLEKFDDAYTDANRSLKMSQSPGLLWKAHEILGHCHAKMKQYKQSEADFGKALESLRKSNAPNEEKAAVAGRVSTVLRMVREENKPKNRAKETSKNQDVKNKQLNKMKEEKKLTADTEEEIEEENDEGDETQCLEKSSYKPEVLKISLGKNPKLKCASVAVSVVVTESRGRCVLANRDIKPGTVVMIDQPFTSVVNADQLHQRCNNCCSRCLASLPCQHCALVVYCSEKCRNDGVSRHRLECSVMTHLYDATLGKMAPLVFRILTTISWQRLKKSKEKILKDLLEDENNKTVESIMEGSEQQKWRWDGHYSPKDYLATLFLVTNSPKRTFGDHFKRALSAAYISQCLVVAGFFGSKNPSPEDVKFVAGLAMRHLQSCSCNAYEISEMQIKGNISDNQSLEIGGAIYPTISLTNHSCFPNVARYNVGTSCVLRATRLIPQGTEILDNYGYYFHVMPLVERRDALRQQYKFECNCEACADSWPLYPHRQGEPIIFRCPVKECNSTCSFLDGRQAECKTCGNKEQYGKLLLNISSKLDDYSNILKLMHEKKFESALKVLLQHQEFLEPHAVYPAKHYTDVQEIMRQCLNCLGNTYEIKNVTKSD